jgi:4-hydroxy-tetrahydrodipicolinate reductase
MIKVIVAGAGGKMGGRLLALAHADPELKVVGAVEAPGHPKVGSDAGEVVGVGKIGVKVVDNLEKVIGEGDVVVEFTSPQATLAHLEQAVAHNKAMVIGTTGYNAEENAKLKSLASKIPCVQTPNMSVGVNVLFKIVAEAAKALGDSYDVEIIEVHHRFKKDAPSGTADKLAHIVAESLGRNLDQVGVYGRKGMVGERKRAEIGVHAIRAGDIAGDHTVFFSNLGERIEIKHQAHSRDAFGQGALRAIKFIVGKPKGLYDMADVLGLKG